MLIDEKELEPFNVDLKTNDEQKLHITIFSSFTKDIRGKMITNFIAIENFIATVVSALCSIGGLSTVTENSLIYVPSINHAFMVTMFVSLAATLVSAHRLFIAGEKDLILVIWKV